MESEGKWWLPELLKTPFKHNNVKISIRRGILRFSLHLYNTLEDVNMVTNLIKDFKTKRD